MVGEHRAPQREVALAGHTHMVVGSLAVDRLNKALVPEMLNMPKTVTEMDACDARRNDEVCQESDGVVADPGTVPVEELVNEEPPAERAADGEAIDAKELN